MLLQGIIQNELGVGNPIDRLQIRVYNKVRVVSQSAWSNAHTRADQRILVRLNQVAHHVAGEVLHVTPSDLILLDSPCQAAGQNISVVMHVDVEVARHETDVA